MSDNKLPDLPTVKFGYVQGPLRVERAGGGDVFLETEGGLLINKEPFAVNTSGDMFAVTHLQKKSWFGFLWMKPFIFHVWLSFRLQKQDANGGWMPGTEIVLYGRTPGWRYDFADAKFIDSKGFLPQGHWD